LKMVLTATGTDLHHVVEDEIDLGSELEWEQLCSAADAGSLFHRWTAARAL